MPSRKLTDRCPKCGAKNHLRARYCNECGAQLSENRAPRSGDGRTRLHADVAHPINAACRERIQQAVIKAYEEEFERSKQPGYKPVSLDDDYDAGDYDDLVADLKESALQRADRRRNGEAPAGDNDRVAEASSEPETPVEVVQPPKRDLGDDFAAGLE